MFWNSPRLRGRRNTLVVDLVTAQESLGDLCLLA